MKKKKAKFLGSMRIPNSKGTIWFKDKSKYSRKAKHKENLNNDYNNNTDDS